MSQLLVVGLGGFLGAVLRYWLSSLLLGRFRGAFPLGTLTVNVLGCLAIGVLWGLLSESRGLSETSRLFLSVGLLGGLTTFSTFGLETVNLWSEGEEALALWSVAANLAFGLGAVWLGRALVRLF